MPHPTVVINIVGLTPSLIGDWSPNLRDFRNSGTLRTLEPVLPAVTTTVQSSMLTGLMPGAGKANRIANGDPAAATSVGNSSGGGGHGIVGNGWFNREYNEIHFWKQSNRLVQGEKVWEAMRRRDPKTTCANMFWWYNMYSSVEVSVTPRPMYKADGRKIPDCYSEPPEWRDRLQADLGQFPLFNFWGPMASIKSSRWIAEAGMIVHQEGNPTLMLIYLPHLDYGLQKLGPDNPRIRTELREIDDVVGELIAFFRKRDTRIMIVSEYGIESVSSAVHLNRILRDEGSLRVREEQGLELLDPGASAAFAVADHQVAHVYLKDERDVARYKSMLGSVHGVGRALDRAEQAAAGIDHERAGDLVLIAEPGRWFSYYYWQDDARAPDFARTVDIHRKPGYDPVELFIDPELSVPKLRITAKLLRKKLGFRTLMDVIPLDASLVRGSHGRTDLAPDRGPLMITEHDLNDRPERLHCTQVRDVILQHLFDD